MKTAISIPDSLFTRAERLAKRLGLSRSELYQRAIEAYVQRHRQDNITEALDRIYGAMPGGGKLDLLLEHLQTSSLSEERW